MSPLLLVLWREQHPAGHEQTNLNFSSAVSSVGPEPAPLIDDELALSASNHSFR
jgi:hypothetical protein